MSSTKVFTRILNNSAYDVHTNTVLLPSGANVPCRFDGDYIDSTTAGLLAAGIIIFISEDGSFISQEDALSSLIYNFQLCQIADRGVETMPTTIPGATRMMVDDGLAVLLGARQGIRLAGMIYDSIGATGASGQVLTAQGDGSVLWEAL